MELRELCVFAWLDPDALARLSASAEPRTLAAGGLLTRAGEPAAGLFALTDGAVRVDEPPAAAVEEGAGAVWGALDGAPEPATVSALPGARVLFWSSRSLAQAFAADPSLRAQLVTRLSLRRRRDELEQLLRACFLFRDTSPLLLRRLLQQSTLGRFAAHDPICRQGEPGDALYVIVSGEIEILVEDAGGPRVVGVLRAGDCFGETALVRAAPRSASAVALGEAELLMVGKRAFDALAQQSRPFLRQARALAEERVQASKSRPPPQLVFVDNQSRQPTATLAALVGQALEAEVGEPVAQLAIGGELAQLDAAIGESNARYLLCFAPRPLPQLRAQLGARVATELRFLDGGRAPLHPAQRFVHDVWVGTHAPRGQRAAGDLRLPLSGALDATLAGAAKPVRAALGRIARAIAHRRVGLALSGGGAWGYAHCALLRGLERVGVPVDVISGSSFGAVVGAMYASHGLDGLDELLALHRHVRTAARLSMISSWPIERFVERHMGAGEIDDLDPAFLPVAVDVCSARETIFRSGRLSIGVRASCAFPGVYGPALRDGRRFIDGAMARNVPVSTLRDEGADFVIASSIIPPPDPRPLEHHGSRLGRLWAELSPIGRARDITRALLLLGHSLSRELAASAEVVFSPSLSPYSVNDWGKAPQIVALAEQQLETVLENAARRHAAL